MFSGAMTVEPGEDIKAIFAGHDGRGAITLNDGYHYGGDYMEIGARRLTVRAANIGGATIVGGFDVAHASLRLRNVNLRPPDANYLLRLMCGMVEMDGVYVDATAATAHLIQTKLAALTISARERQSDWIFGPLCGEADIEFTLLKIVGNISEHYNCRFENQAGPAAHSKQMFVLDNAELTLAGGEFVGAGQVRHGRAVDLRRNGSMTAQGPGNSFRNFDRACIARGGSVGHVDAGVSFHDCKRALSQIKSGIFVDQGAVFDGNLFDITDENPGVIKSGLLMETI